MTPGDPQGVILLPGGVLPAGPAYRALIEALGTQTRCVPKDLEIYAGEEPPPDYGLDLEIAGVLRAAADAGLDRFKIVGYSAGGQVALATAARHPERVSGLGLIEFGPLLSLDTVPGGDEWVQQMEHLITLSAEARIQASASMLLKPGVQPPTPLAGPPPPWMAKRPAALEYLMRLSFHRLDLDALARYRGPAYLALGSLSHPSFERQARRLAELWPQMEIDVYEGLHHLKPPHLADPGRLATSLLQAWSRPAVTEGN